MKKCLLFLALALMLGCKKPTTKPNPIIQTDIERQHSTTHRVGVYQQFEGNPKHHHGEVGHCSGSAIGPHALLTAQHCFHDSNLVRLDDQDKPVEIVAALIDGNDHVIYLLRYDFSSWAHVDQRPLVAKEPVKFWGAPGKNSDVFRVGYFDKMATEAEIDKKFKLQKFILPTFAGDSGSGIFDQYGNVVAVITYADESANELSEPLQFTDDQLDIAITE